MPTHDIDILPVELILGYLVYNIETKRHNFVLNNRYISLISDYEKSYFNDYYIDLISKEKWAYSIDENGYQKAQLWIKLHPKAYEDPNCGYASMFLKKYELRFVTAE